jgi:hypothetical protein
MSTLILQLQVLVAPADTRSGGLIHPLADSPLADSPCSRARVETR